MSKFFIGAEELGESEQVDFAEFIQLLTGRSIVSGADWGGGRVEFGLSGEGMLRVTWKPNGIDVRLFSTTNRGEIPSLLLALPEEQRRPRSAKWKSASPPYARSTRWCTCLRQAARKSWRRRSQLVGEISIPILARTSNFSSKASLRVAGY